MRRWLLASRSRRLKSTGAPRSRPGDSGSLTCLTMSRHFVSGLCAPWGLASARSICLRTNTVIGSSLRSIPLGSGDGYRRRPACPSQEAITSALLECGSGRLSGSSWTGPSPPSPYLHATAAVQRNITIRNEKDWLARLRSAANPSAFASSIYSSEVDRLLGAAQDDHQ